MKITAITKYKHGELYAILQRIGWKQADLARQANVLPTRIGEIINLQRRPTKREADEIQRALGTVGEYFDVLSEWPETFAGLKRGYRLEQTADIPVERLLDHPEVLQIAAPEYEESELEERVESVMIKIPARDREILRKRFWENKTYKEISNEMGVSSSRIHSIEDHAIRLLRHPVRIRKLMPHLFEGIDLPYDPEDKP